MSRLFDCHWLMEGVARQMWRSARCGRYNGIVTPRNALYLDRCTADHVVTGTRLIFTFDEGMHFSGWWKNPDYERCWHLSVSFLDPFTGHHRDRDNKLTAQWIDAFYHSDKSFVWAEPPYTQMGKQRDVWHYRVFCDPAWQPIVPRGEVYSKEFTERGWLSFSDLQNQNLLALEAQAGEQ